MSNIVLKKLKKSTSRLLNYNKPLVIALLSLTLVGCSSGFVYRNLSWITPWYVDDFLDLNDQQEQQLKSIIDNGLQWHKATELPRYIDFLQYYIKRSDQTLDMADVKKVQLFIEDALNSLQAPILDEILPLFISLNDNQKQQFWSKIQEKTKDLEEEYLSRTKQEYLSQLQDRYISNFEYWLGPLTKPQKELTIKALSKLQRNDQGWLQTRALWLGGIEKLHLQTSDQQTAIKDTLLNRSLFESAESQRLNEQNIVIASQLAVDALALRTEKQSSHLKDELVSWQRKLKRWQK